MTTFTRNERTVTLDEFVAALNARMMEYCDREMGNHPNLHSKENPYYKVEAVVGHKYIKLIQTGCSSRSVYCFITPEGDILKASSWKAPAKGVRGSVFDENYSWGKGLGIHGATYFR